MKNASPFFDKGISMPKKNLFKKWETWVGFFVAILTLVSLIVEVPQKIASLFKSEEEHAESEIVQVLAGCGLDIMLTFV